MIERYTDQKNKAKYQIYQYQHAKSFNKFYPMKHYQFKTLQPNQPPKPPTVPPPKNLSTNNIYINNPPQQQFTYTQTSINQSNNFNASNVYNPADSAQPLLNLSNLKKQLDNLIKQTDYIENGKKGNLKIGNQGSFQAARSLSNGAKVNSRDMPDRTQRMKNYQKYQKSIDQTNPYKATSSNANKIGSQTSIRGDYPDLPQNIKNAAFSSNYIPNQPSSQNQLNKKVGSNSFYLDYSPGQSKTNDNAGGYKGYPIPPTSPKTNNPQSIANKSNFQVTNNMKTSPMPNQPIKNKNFIGEFEPPIPFANKFSDANKYNNDINAYSKQQATTNQVREAKGVQSSDIDSITLKFKIKDIESQRDKLKQNLSKVQESKQYYRTELFEQRQKSRKLQEAHAAKIAQMVSQKQSQIAKLHQNYNSQISNTKQSHQNQLKALTEQHRNQLDKNQAELQQTIQKYEQVIQNLESELSKKNGKIVNLIKQFQENQSAPSNLQTNTQQIQGLFNTLADKQHQIIELHNQLNSREQHIQMLNQTFQELRNQIEELKAFKNEVETQNLKDFDEILMTQMKTIQQLKDNLQLMSQRLNQSKLALLQSSRSNQSLQNQLRILQFKQKSEISGLKTQKQIQFSNLQNTISTLNKKMLTMEQKLKFAANQIKKKDDFVKQYLVGRSTFENSKEFIQDIFQKYQSKERESKEEELLEKLERVQKQLELYERYMN